MGHLDQKTSRGFQLCVWEGWGQARPYGGPHLPVLCCREISLGRMCACKHVCMCTSICAPVCTYVSVGLCVAEPRPTIGRQADRRCLVELGQVSPEHAEGSRPGGEHPHRVDGLHDPSGRGHAGRVAGEASGPSRPQPVPPPPPPPPPPRAQGPPEGSGVLGTLEF